MSYLCCTQSLPTHMAAAVRQTPPTPRAPVTTTTPCVLRQQAAFARALQATLEQQGKDAVSCYVCVYIHIYIDIYSPHCFLYSSQHSWELIATKPARVYACCCKIFFLNGITFLLLPLSPRSGELRTQKLKSHLVRTQSLNVLPLKPGVSQYIAIHATPTARDFFLAYFYTSGPFTRIFFQNLSRFFPVLAVANTWFLCRPAE